MDHHAKGSSWHISRIQITAFKSFSQSAIFDVGASGLVGILGPNGSGKSNLLEAVCFATGCSTAVLRGCRTLRDVSSTDTAQHLPEVKLQFSSGRSNVHLLETALTPEGTRQHRIDGRLKTGKQVKDFLHSLGIVVDATTVIQQAAITRLTNSNNPATLAELVAAASGLGSWSQESAAARQEVVRTRRALTDIEANISKVQAAADADGKAVQAALTAERLESELETVLEELVSMLLQQQAGSKRQLLAAQGQQQELEVLKVAAAEQVEQLTAQKQQLATGQARVLADLEACTSGRAACSLVGDIAAAEAKLSALQEEAAAHAARTAELSTCRRLLQQQQSMVQQLQGMLQLKQDAADQACTNLAAISVDSSAACSARQQLSKLQKQVAAATVLLAQQQAAVHSKAGQLQQAKAAVTAVQQQLQIFDTQQPTSAPAVVAGVPPGCEDSSVTTPATAASAAAAVADNHVQQVNILQQQVLQLQVDHEACAASLTPHSISALLSTCSHNHLRSSSTCTARPLHQCFTVKNAASQQNSAQLLVPLAVIAGPSVLQVVVANSTMDANVLLRAAAAGCAEGKAPGRNAGAKLRIWPLDNLKASNFIQRQRASQQALGSDRVILPLDLMEYHPDIESAMIKAFGSFVIAADEATSAELVQRFGLSSVSLQGTVSVKGSMSGGWSGNSKSFAQGYWASKLRHDALVDQLDTAQRQLAQAVAMQQRLEARRNQAESASAAAEQQQLLQLELQRLQADTVAAEVSLQQEQNCLSTLELRHANLQQHLQRCKEVMHSSQGAQGHSSSSKAAAAAAALMQQVEDDSKAAAAEALEAQEQLHAAEDKVEQIAVRIETLELQLSASADTEQQQQLQLQQQSIELQQLQQQQTEKQHAVRQLSDKLAQLQQQTEEAQRQLQQQQNHLRALLQRAQRTGAEAAAAAAIVKKSKQALRQLAQEFGNHDALQDLLGSTPSPAVLAPALAAAAASQPGTELQEGAAGDAASKAAAAPEAEMPSANKVQQLTRQSHRLHQEILQLDVPNLPAAQKELFESRMAQVLQFKRQAGDLEAAAAALEHHIACCADQVYAANEVVYEDIAAGFTELCSSLLPSLELQLHKTGTLAHEGLQFRFRRLEDTCSAAAAVAARQQAAGTSPALPEAGVAYGSGSLGWQVTLSQLSGGQQTMVSLAMLLAVARSGHGSKLFLLDEIDAALDQHNQTRAAALLKQLAAGASDGSSCQILCVTHNAAFQEACDAFLKVSRGPGGSSMPAAAITGDQGETVADVSAKCKVAAISKKARTAAKAAGKTTARASGNRPPYKKVRFSKI